MYWTDWGTNHYFGLLILRDLKKSEKAMELLKNLKDLSPGDWNIQWCIAKYTGNLKKAEAIEKKMSDDPRLRIMVEAARFIEVGI